MDLQKNIDRYLDIERILNTLFNGLGYCLDHCILKPDKYGHCLHSACCKHRYYKRYDFNHPALLLLKAQRDAIYPTPESLKNIKRISPCEYLTINGCLLKTHKSPVCIGYLCRDAIDVLREKFDVYGYDYLGINYALEWILTGDLDGSAYDEFRNMCLDMAEKVNGKL